jgi:hypothetical protein
MGVRIQEDNKKRIIAAPLKTPNFSSLQVATRRSNPGFSGAVAFLDCFAALAKTVFRGALSDEHPDDEHPDWTMFCRRDRVDETIE